MHPLLPAIALLLPVAIASTGCGGQATCEGGCDGSDGGGGNSTGTTTTGTTTGTTTTGTTTTGTTTADGVAEGVDPVVITFGSYTPSCSNPDPPFGDCGWWQVEVRISASAVVPGPVNFSSPYADGFMQSSTPDPTDPSICSGGGGSFIGDFIIDSVGADQIVVTMSGTDAFDVPAGTYVAARCP